MGGAHPVGAGGGCHTGLDEGEGQKGRGGRGGGACWRRKGAVGDYFRVNSRVSEVLNGLSWGVGWVGVCARKIGGGLTVCLLIRTREKANFAMFPNLILDELNFF